MYLSKDLQNHAYPLPMHIGKNIRILRKQAGLTQVELAKALGIKQQVVANYEKEVTNPEVAKLPTLAKVLGVSIESLFNAERPAGEIQAKIKRKNSREVQAQEAFLQMKPEYQRAILKQMRMLGKSGD
ncbi:MAG: helix-turn-helix transcriptional regulator [Devosia sp.]